MSNLALSILLAAALIGSVQAETVVFAPAPEPDTGLKAIIEKWHADELQRQGGKFGSHGWWPWGLEAFDYDNDGDLDLVAQHHGAPRSMILKNTQKETGKLAFVNANPELGLPAEALSGTFRPVVWDIDGDGFLDLGYNSAEPNTLWFNKGGKSFEAMGYAFGQLEGVNQIGDLNGDGYLDAASVKSGSKHLYDPATRKFKREDMADARFEKLPATVKEYISELKKDAKNRFLKAFLIDNGDLNGDGLPDLVVNGFAAYGGATFGRYLLAAADGTYADATESLGLPLDATPVYLADVNGDGRDDIFAIGAGLYASAEGGRFVLKPGPLTEFLKARGNYPHKIYPADFDADGRPDFVVSNARGGAAVIYANAGDGAFRECARTGAWDADPVVVCDLDGDGAEDVCVGGPGTTVSVFLNRSTTPGQRMNVCLRMDKPNPFAVGALLESFKAGEMSKPGARPFRRVAAPSNGLAIAMGLGAEKSCDLRITFPGKEPKIVTLSAVEARTRVTITPNGLQEDSK